MQRLRGWTTMKRPRARTTVSLLQGLVSILLVLSSTSGPVDGDGSFVDAVTGTRFARQVREDHADCGQNEARKTRALPALTDAPAETGPRTWPAPPHNRGSRDEPIDRRLQEGQPRSSVPTTSTMENQGGTTGTNNSTNDSDTAMTSASDADRIDCSFQDELPLKHGFYSLKHIVNPLDNTILVEFTFHELGWVSFGVSPRGTMVGGEVVIAKTDEPAGPTNPGKYVISSKTSAGVTLMGAQTLMNASWTQSNESTTLRYVKWLREEGEVPIDPDQSNTFIFAAGMGNDFADHGLRFGKVTLPSLTKCVVPGWSGSNGSINNETADGSINNDASAGEITVARLWALHGTLMAVAWAILVPVAIGFSLLRDFMGARLNYWFQIHAVMNATAAFLQTVALGVALYCTNRDRGALHFHGRHESVGLAVYIASLAQVLSGFLRPGLPTPNQASACQEELEEEVRGDPDATLTHSKVRPTVVGVRRQDRYSGVETDDDSEIKEPPRPKKSCLRRAFEIVHRGLGLALVGLAWYNCSTGIHEMVEHYGDSYDKSSTLWGVVGGLSGFILLMYMYQLLGRGCGSRHAAMNDAAPSVRRW